MNPSGDTRQSAQEDFQQKEKLARGANAAFITAGALAVISTAMFIIYRDDIFGRVEE